MTDRLKSSDEDRWLAARYAPTETRDQLLALGALATELRRIPSMVSEPPLGEIRLQWWREVFREIARSDAPHAHPVVAMIASSGVFIKAPADSIDSVIDAAARPLYGEGFTDIDDLVGWMSAFEGALDGLAVRALGGDEDVACMAQQAGAIFALAREGRVWAPALIENIHEHVNAKWPDMALQLKQVLPKLSPAIAHLSLTRDYLRYGSRPFPVRKRLRIFSAVGFGAY